MLAIKYATFALTATLVNLLTQKLVMSFSESAHLLYLALFFGTITGLVCKYLLDKHFIFQFTTNSLREDGRTFVLYSLVGVFTTVLFWGFELGFALWFEHENAMYLGGAIGLTLGYIIKYQLDKRFVFVKLQTLAHNQQ